jgi:hypothetical protein
MFVVAVAGIDSPATIAAQAALFLGQSFSKENAFLFRKITVRKRSYSLGLCVFFPL